MSFSSNAHVVNLASRPPLNRPRFLWVVFQIDSICAQKSDEGILATLQDLPRDLPETFKRILHKLDESEFRDPNFCSKIFKIIYAAHRPLTLDELQEAASVEPGDTMWKPERSINDIAMSLRSCGSFLTIDVDEATVHFAHTCVKQYLSQSVLPPSLEHYSISPDAAQLYMADVVVTYITYEGKFATQITTQNDARISVPTDMVSPILGNMMGHGKRHEMARAFLRSRGKAKGDVRHNLQTRSSPDTKQNIHPFLPYTQQFWLDHTRVYPLPPVHQLDRLDLDLDSPGMVRRVNFYALIEGTCTAARVSCFPKSAWPDTPDYFLYACGNQHEPLLAESLEMLIHRGSDSRWEYYSGILPDYDSVSSSLRTYYDTYTAKKWSNLAQSKGRRYWADFLGATFPKQGVDGILVAVARKGYSFLLKEIMTLGDIPEAELGGKAPPSKQWPRIAINEAIIYGEPDAAVLIFAHYRQFDPDILEYEGPHGNARATAACFGRQDIMDGLAEPLTYRRQFGKRKALRSAQFAGIDRTESTMFGEP